LNQLAVVRHFSGIREQAPSLSVISSIRAAIAEGDG
jgi:hypothetical protein